MKTTLQALRALLVLTLLTGVLYPMLVTGLSVLTFPRQAGGSLLRDASGRVIGSTLLAQKFASPRYFWPRPSAGDFATVASGASNKGPTSADLARAVTEGRARLGADAPAELLTTSGSGLDPHLSPAGAKYQIPRIAAARGVSAETLAALVDQLTEGPDLGFLGEPRVNVLHLNRALDALR